MEENENINNGHQMKCKKKGNEHEYAIELPINESKGYQLYLWYTQTKGNNKEFAPHH